LDQLKPARIVVVRQGQGKFLFVNAAPGKERSDLKSRMLNCPPGKKPYHVRNAAMLLKGRYLIERELGRGAIGVVYLARDQKLYAKPVVVKMLLEDQADQESLEYFRKKFRDEVEALARINHAGVVSVLDRDETPDGTPYLVMEYVEGVNLRSAMGEQGMDLARVGRLMPQIGRALVAAHKERIIHRDLKPENIMLQTADGEERIKLIDFGIAKVEKRADAELTTKTAVAGTVPYMAPEQLSGETSPASDIYTLGVIAYELVTGQLPFKPPSHWVLRDWQRAGVKVLPTSLRPELPVLAQEVILQALSFEPQARQPTALEFCERLAQALITQSTSNTGVYTDALQPGALLDERYRIVRQLGGSLTTIYLAEDLRRTRQQVVVKELHGRVADKQARQQATAAFNREAGLLARLTHPALPQVCDFFYKSSRGRYYLVTELIVGDNLAARLREAGGRLGEKTVTEWAWQICEALAYLHAHTPPVIYRDLSPTNLMIETQTKRIKLIDFGLTRVVAPPARGSASLATLGYAAPEALRGQPEPRSDIYSLGAVMFHLLTGCDPSETPLLVFDFGKYPTPRQLVPELSAEIEQLICSAVKYEAENRVASAQVFGQLLREHLALLTSRVPTLVTEALAVVRCSHCGRAAEPDALFCGTCGRRLRQMAKLRLLSGSGDLAEWELKAEGETLLGRIDPQQGIYPQIDLTKHDPTSSVSRRHAQIHQCNDQFFLEDLGSSNGTFLNGSNRLLKGEQHALTNGAELKLGEVKLRFVSFD
jgi:serine/threonine protein kinase